MNYTERGALLGGGLGAGAGAIVGSAFHNTAGGALIGAGLGAITGALTGNAVDEVDAKQKARLAAATAPVPGGMGMTDVIQMSQQRVGDDVIINQIRVTRSVFNLSPNDIVWLKQCGVSDIVVQEMQATAYRPRRVYAPGAVYVAEPVYVVPPPPPPAIGIGFGYYRR